MQEEPNTPLGKCGSGAVCDCCPSIKTKSPCVTALHELQKERKVVIDYETPDYESVWFWGKQGYSHSTPPLA